MNFTDVLVEHANNQPDHPAIIDGGRVTTYRDLDGRVTNAAANLRVAGIGPGDIVAVTLSDSAEYLVVTLALARTGAIMAAIDEALPGPEKVRAVSTAGIKAIVLENPQNGIGDLPVLPVAAVCGAASVEYDRQPTDPDHPLMIVQSSGTTGTPKSFFWSHRSMVAQAIRHERCFGWSRRDRYLAVVHMKFFWERELCFVLLYLGATVVVNRGTSAAELVARVREQRITILALTPSHLPPLLNHASHEFPLFPSVATMVVGSAPMTHERRLLVRQLLTPNFNEQLGTNETGLLVVGTPADQDAEPDAVGRVVAGVDVQIVGPSGHRAAAGTVGLVGFRGEGFPTGYIDNPEATARGFREGWFYPGDLAAIDEQGYFHFKGRADDVINNQGVKFYPVEVEKALLAHPAIAEAAVIGWPDPVCGQTAIAFVVMSRQVSAGELDAFCRQRIALHKLPSRFTFVDRLPRNATGKIMKSHLGKLYRELSASEVVGGDSAFDNEGSVAKIRAARFPIGSDWASRPPSNEEIANGNPIAANRPSRSDKRDRAEMKPMANVADVITRHAAERPWAVAIIENDTMIHYRRLERLVWAAAWHLRRAGIAPGDVVGLALPHSALYLVAIYALARMGAVSLALPQSDPVPVRESFARRFGVKWVVATSDGAGPSAIPTVVLTPASLEAAPKAIAAEIRAAGGDAPWNIRRTSGTTSEAKGIAATHRALLARCEAHMPLFYGPHDRVLSIVSIDTAFGISACERTLFGGGCVVLAPLQIDAPQFLHYIDRYGVTHVSLTPNFLTALLPHLPSDGCRAPLLRQISTTGMAMPEAVRAEIRRRFNRRLLVLYATNEAAYLTAADADMQERCPETVGRAMPGVELQVVDDDDVPVGPGEPGHIRARTSWMPSGYVNPRQTQNRTFRNGWIYTGDVGVLDAEGMLFVKGRSDDMMNYDGIKIMPADIEEALLAHPAVAEAVAFPVASSLHQHLPAAAVVLRHPAKGEELMAHCRRLLGGRAPLAISTETSFPRNAAGKVVRRELAAKVAARLPQSLK